MLHYNPRHVSSINMPIFRRTNFIITASVFVTLCTVQYSMADESRLLCSLLSSGILYGRLQYVCYIMFTICMLHYNPRHVSSINMPIFRRTNCIITASVFVTLCTVQYSTVCRMRADCSAVCSHPAYCTAFYRE